MSPSAHGFGIRADHYVDFLASSPDVGFAEVISENFIGRGGLPASVLEHVRELGIDLTLHGVSMAIGNVDPLDLEYLHALRELADRVEPTWVSDHLCWGGFGGHAGHDLWPLPFDAQTLDHVAERVDEVQGILRRPLVLENASSYVEFRQSEMGEADFLAELCRRTGAGILLDVNNVYVSSRNHGFDPLAYLDTIPVESVRQFHLAGHADKGDHLLDDHASEVCEAVWALHREAVRRFGHVPTIVEWDSELPPLERLVAEAHRARNNEREALESRA